jgi:hypothetical protein
VRVTCNNGRSNVTRTGAPDRSLNPGMQRVVISAWRDEHDLLACGRHRFAPFYDSTRIRGCANHAEMMLFA